MLTTVPQHQPDPTMKLNLRRIFTASAAATALLLVPTSARAAQTKEWEDFKPSSAYLLMDAMLEDAADEVVALGARPTILSRQMAICTTAMYDAWAAYDGKAVGVYTGGRFRQPLAKHTERNKRKAMAYAMYRCILDQYPGHSNHITALMKEWNFDLKDESTDLDTPEGLGNRVARTVLEARYHDGANQLGDEVGSNGKPYSDYTYYQPANPIDKILDPDRWQQIPFDDGKGGKFYPNFLTAQWFRLKPFGLERPDQFRPPPPPKVGSEQLKREVDEAIHFNATLTPEQKAVVEFMRDGPRSTGQSGHWLHFALATSRRDNNDTDTDVKMYMAVANTAMDAFIASWECKRYYDSSRPYALVRYYYAGKEIDGWLGPGKGVGKIKGENWIPYSPAIFVTPPFPGYTSGHATVSAGCAKMLELFTGSPRFGDEEKRVAGSMTEDKFSCAQMQSHFGTLEEGLSCDVLLDLPTYWDVAEMAALSRLMGGYHIRTDNEVGLVMGKQVAEFLWPKCQAYFNGTVN